MQQPSSKKRILVGVLHQGWIRPEMYKTLFEMQTDKRFDVTIYFSNIRPSENNRNFLVQKALEEGYDYLLNIDHDIVPLKKLLDLVGLKKDVIGGAFPAWNTVDPNYPLYFIAMDRAEDGYREHKEKVGLQEVDAVGSGGMLLSRAVMEAVKEPFLRKWKDGFAITGLDFFFCEKAKDLGFKVFCHYDYPCSHYKDLDLLQVLKFKQNG